MCIPKIVHYCWFGNNEMPDIEKKCIESWKVNLDGYKFMVWNEDTFDINSVKFVKEAYDNKKYAFVSDYVRMYALYKYGGIYLDTDIEVLTNLDIFMEGQGFLGFENQTNVGTGVMAFKKEHEICRRMIEHYNNSTFIDENGNFDTITNVKILANILEGEGLERENKEQEILGVKIYTRNIFFPKKMKDGTFRTSNETVTIHYFSGSWLTEREKRRGENILWIEIARPILRKFRSGIKCLLGEKKTRQLEINIRNILR